MEAKIHSIEYFDLQVRCPYYWPIAVKVTRSAGRAWRVTVLSFRNGSRDTAHKGICSQSKVPFITGVSQPNLHRFQKRRGECEIWRIRKIPPTEAEIHMKKCFVMQIVSLIINRAQPRLARFVAHAWKMRSMRFHEYPSNWSRDTDENVLRSPTKHYSPIAATLTEYVAHASRIRSIKIQEIRYIGSRDRTEIKSLLQHAWKMRGMKFLEYPANGSRDTGENVLRSPTTCPSLLTDRNHTYRVCSACVENSK